MIGNFNLGIEEIKLILENYYKEEYKGVKICFIDVDYSKSKTGIMLERDFNVNEEQSIKIQEELEKEDIVEVLNKTFEKDGYTVENIIINKKTTGSGWSECVSLNNIGVVLKKEKVKQKTL